MTDERKNVVLRIVSGPGNGTTLDLGIGRHIVGAGAGCALQIVDDSVAALHAMIIVGDDVLRVYPIQRTVLLAERKNGADSSDLVAVEVNGTEVHSGQQIRIGDAVIVLLVQEAAESMSPDHREIEARTPLDIPAPRIIERPADIVSDHSSESVLGDTTVGIESIDGNPGASDPVAPSAPAAMQQSAVKQAVSGAATNAVEAVRQSSPASTDRLGPYGRAKEVQEQQQLANLTFESPAPKPIGSDQMRRPRISNRPVRKQLPDRRATAGPTQAAQRTVNRAAAATARRSDRALVTVPVTDGGGAKEAFALVAVGAVEVHRNIKSGFLSFWRDGISVSQPLVLTALLACMIGLLFIADRQTVAVNDYSVSPARSLSSELNSLGFAELEVMEDDENRIHLSGFVGDEQKKDALAAVMSNYDDQTFFSRDVTVATELLNDIGEVLVQYGMSGLKRTYLGDGRVKIEGYVGPEHDWDAAVTTLGNDFPVIEDIDDSGVETLSVRLMDMKEMLEASGLKNLVAAPEGAKIEVTGAVPVLDTARWVAVMDRFRTKYDNNPAIINKVEEIVPGQLVAVPVEGTAEIYGKKFLLTEIGNFAEGETMPDGTEIVRIERHGIVFGRNGYEYMQPYYSYSSGIAPGEKTDSIGEIAN